MKLIIISGAKNSKKDLLAMILSNRSDCIWIKPYSNRKDPVNADPHNDYISLNDRQLNDKIAKEVPLAETIINSNRFVFFENQLKKDYTIIIGDDNIVFGAKNNWKGEIITVRCHSKHEVESPRFLFKDDEFDYVFNYGDDDIDELRDVIFND